MRGLNLARHSIGARIFGAFVLMGLLIGVLGLAGYGVLSSAGQTAMQTFDGPLQAIDLAHAAHEDFTEMQVAELRFEHAPAARQAAIAAEIADRFQTFESDLATAAQLSQEGDEQKLIREI